MDTRSIAVLLIEDDANDALLIRRYLSNTRKVPYEVNHVDRLRTGLELLNRGGVDIVLLDLELPDGHGLSSFDELHALVPHIPVIVLTGHDNDDVAVEAVRKGAQDFLVKGKVDGSLLQRAVRYAVERNKLLTELKQAENARRESSEELERLNDLLARQATTDSLTGISNRLKFGDTLNAEISRSRRYALPLSLIMFDIDHFKGINDTYGHLAGDGVLVGLAALVSKNVRAHDLFARWGGEEFMIMVTNSSLDNARMFADKLRHMIEQCLFRGGIRVTCSFGVAQFLHDESDDRFIQRVDDALYLAKARGRNRLETA
jgi:diguanylate cyclase (GGDEF)-like protein